MGTCNKIASATVSWRIWGEGGREWVGLLCMLRLPAAALLTISLAHLQIKWLSRNYETADGVSLPRSTLYNHYMQHCNEQKLEPVNAASFGKLIRSVFSGLRTRRLGTRGNSKYHYYGIRIKPGSLLIHHQSMDDKSLQAHYGASPGNGSIANVSSSSSNSAGGGGASAGGGGTGSINQLGNSNGSLPSATGQRTSGSAKKHNFKPETYEACIQVGFLTRFTIYFWPNLCSSSS